MINIPAPTTLDWISEARLLHMIGAAVSKEFGSAERLVRRVAGANAGQVQFSSIVELLSTTPLAAMIRQYRSRQCTAPAWCVCRVPPQVRRCALRVGKRHAGTVSVDSKSPG